MVVAIILASIMVGAFLTALFYLWLYYIDIKNTADTVEIEYIFEFEEDTIL